jgi:hypothetical protein
MERLLPNALHISLVSYIYFIVLISLWIHPKILFYSIRNLLENFWRVAYFQYLCGFLVVPIWVFRCGGFYNFFSFFRRYEFTFHTWVRCIKHLFHKVCLIINNVVNIIYIIFTLCINLFCESNKTLIRSFSNISLIRNFSPFKFIACISLPFLLIKDSLFITTCGFDFIVAG